uniref:Uncharacterized protein n=1 Tax=Panagrolaimus sp. ES5 TaxID=591445 RepID=A0AC34GMR9_9BILA
MATALFNKVEVHSSEGDSSEMFNLKLSSLYEIKTVLDIVAEDAFSGEYPRPQVAVHSDKDKLAIGVGPVLHIMRIYPDIRCEKTLSFSSDVCAIRFLANGRFFVVVLGDGSVAFIDTL